MERHISTPREVKKDCDGGGERASEMVVTGIGTLWRRKRENRD